MTEHILKCWPSAYEAIADGRKTFEWRKDDRDFSVGDTLVLRKWDPKPMIDSPEPWGFVHAQGPYGDFIEQRVTVTDVLRGMFGIPGGYCVMAIARLAQAAAPPVVLGPLDDGVRGKIETALAAAKQLEVAAAERAIYGGSLENQFVQAKATAVVIWLTEAIAAPPVAPLARDMGDTYPGEVTVCTCCSRAFTDAELTKLSGSCPNCNGDRGLARYARPGTQLSERRDFRPGDLYPTGFAADEWYTLAASILATRINHPNSVSAHDLAEAVAVDLRKLAAKQPDAAVAPLAEIQQLLRERDYAESDLTPERLPGTVLALHQAVTMYRDGVKGAVAKAVAPLPNPGALDCQTLRSLHSHASKLFESLVANATLPREEGLAEDIRDGLSSAIETLRRAPAPAAAPAGVERALELLLDRVARETWDDIVEHVDVECDDRNAEIERIRRHLRAALEALRSAPAAQPVQGELFDHKRGCPICKDWAHFCDDCIAAGRERAYLDGYTDGRQEAEAEVPESAQVEPVALRADRWIPCSERMPQKSYFVLVCAEGYMVRVACYSATDGYWLFPNADGTNAASGEHRVTHWMRAPGLPGAEPPAEQPEQPSGDTAWLSKLARECDGPNPTVDYDCNRCGGHYECRNGCEDTGLCDQCAQRIAADDVPKLIARVAELEAQLVEAKEAVAYLLSMHKEENNNLRIQLAAADQLRAAERAELEAWRASAADGRQICAVICNLLGDESMPCNISRNSIVHESAKRYLAAIPKPAPKDSVSGPPDSNGTQRSAKSEHSAGASENARDSMPAAGGPDQGQSEPAPPALEGPPPKADAGIAVAPEPWAKRMATLQSELDGEAWGTDRALAICAEMRAAGYVPKPKPERAALPDEAERAAFVESDIAEPAQAEPEPQAPDGVWAPRIGATVRVRGGRRAGKVFEVEEVHSGEDGIVVRLSCTPPLSRGDWYPPASLEPAPPQPPGAPGVDIPRALELLRLIYKNASRCVHSFHGGHAVEAIRALGGDP